MTGHICQGVRGATDCTHSACSVRSPWSIESQANTPFSEWTLTALHLVHIGQPTDVIKDGQSTWADAASWQHSSYKCVGFVWDNEMGVGPFFVLATDPLRTLYFFLRVSTG